VKTLLVRPLDRQAPDEIERVAERMRLTLVEVEGEAVGGSLYTMDWLRERVRWHLDASACTGEVFVAEAPGEGIVGHTIVRVEHGEDGQRFGLFSTTYVVPAWRRHGVAAALLERGQAWLLAQGLPSISTWTSSTNTPLIALYARHGYAQVERGPHATTGTAMVRLERRWG
jgi:GNAT superfamily N-acetyltransferase